MKESDSIAAKLKMILQLAQEIQAQAKISSEAAISGPVRRYYAQEFVQGTLIGNICSPMAGFERSVIARAEQFEAKLEVEILEKYAIQLTKGRSIA